MIAKPIGALSEADVDRFYAHTTLAANGCLVWTGARPNGYGQFWVNGRATRAHRVAWSLSYGEPAPEMQIDHLCRNRACVLVAHLELTTPRMNSQRAVDARRTDSEHCMNGHNYEQVDWYAQSGRTRPTCKQCKRDVAKRMYAKINGGA